MTPDAVASLRPALMELARSAPGLDLLLLFDAAGLLAAVIETVGRDDVDLVDLARAGGLLRYRAARDGEVLFESRPRAGEQFRLDAAQFWCDAEPVLRHGYEAVLRELDA
jgi:hypothetical protein